MYLTLLTIHSLFRYLVLLSLGYASGRAIMSLRQERTFKPVDNTIRHWTATIVHIQFMLGGVLYVISPLTRFFMQDISMAIRQPVTTFFGLYHLVLMLSAVVVVTMGSALAKRKETDKEKFSTMAWWFGLGLVLILIAIPWPFMPFASRPYFRPF